MKQICLLPGILLIAIVVSLSSSTSRILYASPAGAVSEAEITTAKEVIEKHLEAVGGAEKIKALNTLYLEGVSGSSVAPPTQDYKLYLTRPGNLKQIGASVLLFHEGECLYNPGEKARTLTGGELEHFRYRVGFYHNAFTLLEWEAFFDKAEFVGKKRYGPHEEYILKFPGAENGRDLMAHIDAKTFLIDRMVYTITHEKAKELKVVNRLRDYKEVEGLMLPCVIHYDKVGWEEGGTQFVIKEVKLNPEIDPVIFESCEVDFGPVTCDGTVLKGLAKASFFGYLQSNIGDKDMAALGIQDREWFQLTVGEQSIKVKYMKALPPGGEGVEPSDILFARYGNYPRLVLLSQTVEPADIITFEVGDEITITRLAEALENKQDDQK